MTTSPAAHDHDVPEDGLGDEEDDAGTAAHPLSLSEPLSAGGAAELGDAIEDEGESVEDIVEGLVDGEDNPGLIGTLDEEDETRDDARELLAELSEFPIGLLEPATDLSEEDEAWVRNMAAGFLHEDNEFHDEARALYAQKGRQGFSDTLAQVVGVPRRVGAVLAGVELLETRAKGFSRYVRVRGKHIESLAASIEDTLCQGELHGAERELTQELDDLLENVTWFAKRGGFAARRTARVAEIDRLWIRVTVDDIRAAQED